MLIETVVGERRAGSGVQQDGRGGPFGELICNDVGLGRYFEAARMKKMFGLSNVGYTVAATSVGALAAALTPIVAIYNPIGGGKAAVIQRVTTQTRSGTPGGPLYIVGGPTSGAITTAVGGTIVDLSMQSGTSAMKPYNNVALTGYVAAGSGAFQLPIGGMDTGTTTAGGLTSTDIEIAGMIIVPPGGIVALSGTAAGTTHIVDAHLIWAEIDWPL